MPITVDDKLLTYLNARVGALRLERQDFIENYKMLSRYILPMKGRFLVTDRNKGSSTGSRGNRHQDIINSKATLSLRQATAGMLAGTMSPTRPWFSLKTINKALMEDHGVKVWLKQVELILRDIFNASNLYSMAPSYIAELLLFGTGCMTHVDDFQNVARFYTHTAGSYMIDQDERFKISTVAREYQATVLQLVKQFGLENCSKQVQTMYDKGDYGIWQDVRHIIELNPGSDPSKRLSSALPFRQIYWEPGTNMGADNTERGRGGSVLQISGFREFPAYVTRWELTGEDIYGTDCPAMTSLGDIKSLQIEEKRRMQAIDKMVNPPLRGPGNLRNVPISGLPGGATLYDADGTAKLEPIYTVAPNLQDISLDIERIERRIEQNFYVDLFLAITNMEGIQPRNELDLNHRDQERLLQVGPVLERLHGDYLGPMIDRTFNQGLRADIFPPPPPALQGQVLQVEFISSLARAQRAVATRGIEQVTVFVTGLAQFYPDVLDKFDADQAVDEYAGAVGISPDLIVPDDQVAINRQARQALQQQQQALEMAAAGAATAKDLAAADTSGRNALTDVRDLAQRAEDQARQQ